MLPAPRETVKPIHEVKSKITIAGFRNIILLVFTILAVILSSYDFGTAFILYQVPVPLGELLEIIMLLVIIFISIQISSKKIREENNFTWHPIIEVGKIFMAIFIIYPLMVFSLGRK